MLHRVSLVILPLILAARAGAIDDASPIARHCLPCHARSGTAPIKLETPEDIRRHRILSAMLVEDGTMPPQLAAASQHLATRAVSAADRAGILSALRDARGTGSPASGTAGRVLPDLAPAAAWRMPDAGGVRIRTFVVPTGARRIRGVRFSEPAALATSPIRFLSLVADPARSLRRLEGSDNAPGFEAMGNAGRSPSGALGALSRCAPVFELPPGFHFELPDGDIAIETLCEPIGREAEVLPELTVLPAPPGESRAIRALALPVGSLMLEAGTCSTRDVRLRAERDIEVVAVIVKGGAFVRSVTLDAGSERLLEIADFRMAFNEPWLMRSPVRVGAGTELLARFGFDNTRGNPQQPSEPPRDVEAGLPPFGEDAIAVVLYADLPASR